MQLFERFFSSPGVSKIAPCGFSVRERHEASGVSFYTNWRTGLTIVLLAAGFAFGAAPAHADRDAVQFFSDIHVTADNSVSDAVCFFCSVRIDGKVTGDVVVFFGSVHLSGEAQHDVVNIFGDVRADDNASIEDDLVSVFGNVRLGNNVTVGQDLVTIFGFSHVPGSVAVHGDRVMLPGWMFFGPLLLIAIAVYLIVSKYRAYR